MNKKILPIVDDETFKVLDEIATMLMDFVNHNQKPFSKKLNNFIAIGMHDIRAGHVAFDIFRKVQTHLKNK